jgi:sugar lactone lactonase YvrE
VDAAGNVYVADTGNHRIQKFSGDGTYLTQWGSHGSGDGQFQYPKGVAIHAGNVYVTDTGNHRIQEFTDTGVYMSQWGTSGSANGQFQSPQGVAVDDSGNVYVVDSDGNAGGYHHRIEKFTGTGTYLTGWGGYGHGNGQLYSPDGVAVDASGNVFVTDLYNWRIQKFTRMGAYLTQWSSGANAKGVGAPAGIAVNTTGNVYVAESNFFCRIQKFAPTGGL